MFWRRKKQAGKLRVFCHGYNGLNNIGSEAKFLVVLDDLRRALGDRLDEVGVLSLNPHSQRRFLREADRPLVRIYTASFTSLLRIIRRRYDVFLLTEGSTFVDAYLSPFLYIYCIATWMAWLCGLGVVAYVNDCGRLKPLNRRIVRRTLHRCVSMIILRNPDAAARLREYGVTKELHVTADAVYCYPAPPARRLAEILAGLGLDPEKRPVVGIVPKEFFCWPPKLRLWGTRDDLVSHLFYKDWTDEGRRSAAQYVSQMAAFADWCVETFDADVAVISMESMDAQVARNVSEQMTHRERARLLLSDTLGIDDVVSVLSILKFQVTSRYHSAVLASTYAVPMIAVSGDTRCESLFRELGMLDYYIDYVHVPERRTNVALGEVLKQTVRRLTAQEAPLRVRLAAAHAEFLKRAQENPRLLRAWFAARTNAGGACL